MRDAPDPEQLIQSLRHRVHQLAQEAQSNSLDGEMLRIQLRQCLNLPADASDANIVEAARRLAGPH
jgi:hypothetical protein